MGFDFQKDNHILYLQETVAILQRFAQVCYSRTAPSSKNQKQKGSPVN